MACNCATNEQIAALYKQFGHELNVPKDAKLKFKLKNAFTKVCVYVLIVFMLPYLIGYVLYETVFGDKRISLSKFFGLREKIVKEYG